MGVYDGERMTGEGHGRPCAEFVVWKARSRPPLFTVSGVGEVFESAMTEHSICHPGRPRLREDLYRWPADRSERQSSGSSGSPFAGKRLSTFRARPSMQRHPPALSIPVQRRRLPPLQRNPGP
jgi:hypothetical protein